MWLITGPFDEDHLEGQVPALKSKLLKTGRQYGVGRRDQPIQIKSKAISKAHAVLVVGPCDEQQAADPSFVPTLTFENPTDRMRPIERPSLSRPRVLCQPKSSMQLESGDVVHLSASIFVRVRWESVCCYHAPAKGRTGPQISVKHCASLGIHILSTLHPNVTHHLTHQYSLTPQLATSIISVATLVKPEWLAAVLAAGSVESGEISALEQKFALPPTTKYRPSFSPSLPPRLKKFDAWEPNEARAGMLMGYRFVFVGEKGAEAQSALKEIVRRGEGEYECLAVDRGREGLRQVLAKGSARGARLVLVATLDAVIAALGKEGWEGLVEEARSFELKFLHPDKLVEAVVYADAAYVDSALTAEDVPQQSILPDVIPNSIEDEPSVVPESGPLQPSVPSQEPPIEPEETKAVPRRRLPRRAVSRASSRAPSPPPEPAHEPPPADVVAQEPLQPEQPRRTLVRRAGRPKVIEPENSSMDIDVGSGPGRASVEPPASQEPVRAGSAVPPTPSRPSRLKRRVGTQAQSAANLMFPGSSAGAAGDDDVLMPDPAEEPPHKRHRSLFEQYDPDRIARMGVEEYGSQQVGGASGVGEQESMTQYEPSAPSMTFQVGSASAGRSGTSARGALGRSGPGATQLSALVEEEEESTMDSRPAAEAQAQTQARGTKRKNHDEDEDEDEVMQHEGARPKTKRRTEESESCQVQETQAPPANPKPMSKVVTRVDMAQSEVHVKPKPVSKQEKEKAQQGSGASRAEEPDKDVAFLKAVTTKRGKKAENTFDREFNNLRISKPDLEREREDQEWKVLEEFGDDGDVRGNFMIVVEMPVFRADAAEGARREFMRRGEGRIEWQGRVDFKKFKKRDAGERRQPVELVVEEENDLGIGSQYWKGSEGPAPLTQSQPLAEPKSSMTQRSTTQRSTRERPVLLSDSDEEEARPVPKPIAKWKGKSKAVSSQAKGTARTRGKAVSPQRHPLFIDSDEGEGEEHGSQVGEEPSDEDAGGTLRSTVRSGSATQGGAKSRNAGKKKAPAVVVDDDSDDGATLKVLGTRSKTTRRR